MQIQPYLFFQGRCEEAIEFYKRALGAEVPMVMRWKDCPEKPPAGAPQMPPETIMHARLRVGNTMIMASDGMGQGQAEFKGFSLNVTAADEAEANRLFNALADGGQVQMPLTKTFFSPCFGMVADKFGVSWMVYVEGAHP
jgi:PhnB protein